MGYLLSGWDKVIVSMALRSKTYDTDLIKNVKIHEMLWQVVEGGLQRLKEIGMQKCMYYVRPVVPHKGNVQ